METTGPAHTVLPGRLWQAAAPTRSPRRRDRHQGPCPRRPRHVRDLIDVQAASRHHSTADLESLGRRRAHDEFSLEDLRDRLIGADWYEDEDYTAYGLTSRQIEELKAWALEWAKDLGARIHDENA
jgi:hypothetical protein